MARETEELDLLTAERDDLGIQEFLDALGEALTSGNTAAVVSMWEMPAFVIGDDMVEAIEERGELETMFAGARENYNARGVLDTAPEIIRVDEITDSIVCVRVRWPWLDSEGREVGAETSSYTLKRGEDGDWKLRIAIMHGMEAVN